MFRRVKRQSRSSALALLTAFLFFTVCGITNAQQREYPNPPILEFPEDGAVMIYPNPGYRIPFSWKPVDGATAYVINVLTNNFPIMPPLQSEATTIELDLNLNQYEEGTVLQWSVQAVSDSQISPFPAKASFSVGLHGTPFPGQPTPTPIPPPVLLLPENGTDIRFEDNLRGINFDWSDVSGAARYRFTYYTDNEPIHRFLNDSNTVLTFNSQIFKIYQWHVRSISVTGEESAAGERFSFSIGSGVLPTPTPMPPNPDLNNDGALDAADLYHYAANFRTNDPIIDYNNTGLNDRYDILYFMSLFNAGR